jgi:hypothetical protein
MTFPFRSLRRPAVAVACLSLASTLLLGSAGHARGADGVGTVQGPATTPAQERRSMWVTVGGKHRFPMQLEDNPTARAFAQMLPLTLDMPDLNDNEKHVRLPRSLPADAARPGTIRIGDVMLYGRDTLVVFYKTFPSDYSYTRIGRITPTDGLVAALGPGNARIEFKVD